MIIVLDSAGEVQWTRSFDFPAMGSPPLHFDSQLVCGPNGELVMTGGIDYQDPIDFGGGPLISSSQNDAFVAVFDAAGNHQWSELVGAGADHRGVTVALTARSS